VKDAEPDTIAPAVRGARRRMVGSTGSLLQHAEAVRGAYACITERALRADVAIFTVWCAESGRELPAFPQHDLGAARDYPAAEKSEASRRPYHSDVRIFIACCEARGLMPR
jgi:hypothetical protein